MRCELCKLAPAVAVATVWHSAWHTGKPGRAVALCDDCLTRGKADRTLQDVVPISDVETQRLPPVKK